MRSTSRTWYLLSALLFVAAVWFWLRGNEEVAKQKAAGKPAPGQSTNLPQLKSAGAVQSGQTNPAGAQQAASASPGSVSTPPSWQSRFPYRLRNTDESLDQLGLSDAAVLLDNAFIDTTSSTPVVIPAHLRAEEDPGSYVVQSRGTLDGVFYQRLQEAGAAFVSYIPNNAALVRATDAVARQLAALPETRAVLRYEPYYKLAHPLLPAAVEQQALPLDRALNVTVFPGEREKAMASFQQLGAEVVAEDRTPFGPVLTVKPHPDSLVALAQLPEVQRIEYANPRALLNDLTRVRVGVSTDTVVTNNHLDLTGLNVVVNINDSGVDDSHFDLAPRVSTTVPIPFTLFDPVGHGTHVAGTIASSGGLSLTVTGADGSLTNADFRGKAPAAGLFVLPIDLQTGPLISDAFLQETAATNNYMTRGRTNAIISNNSWGYINAFEYNASAASFDAAVRDALPGVIGSQPILYVFAAGNSGFGTTNGTVGQADTILSPATAKNVISVGAVENRRGLTNEAFSGFTDSNDEIASFSSRGNAGVGTEGDFGRFKPDVVAPGTFVVSTRSANMTVDPAFPDLGPFYRYESGTSMAAPAVSGVLALMQEFFERKLARGFSPALMKALLINGARPVSGNYDLQVRTPLNFQGWGMVNLTNSLPTILTNSGGEASWPVRFIDQSPDNALATGERHTWNLSVSTNAEFLPLRVTLVWTDPPGNPGAGIKLVNDLDLVVSNRVSGQVFLGNNFPSGSHFTAPNDTNAPVSRDFVNNVENVFVDSPVSGAYTITVIGRRVNVNAVTANTNGVVQDYALVISSGNGQVTNAFTALLRQGNSTLGGPPVTGLTNGVPLLEERVGANFQLAPSTNGLAAQWNFYVFTNLLFASNNPSGLNNGSNVAFVTFLPPNVSRSRNLDADIDLYVSRSPQLTNLVDGVVLTAFKSRNRGGTEVVIFTNAAVALSEVFYIGVKSEDQQSAEYGIAAFSTDVPFESTDPNGNRILRGVPPNALIPDGSASSPGFVPVFAFGISDTPIARVVVTNEITHQSVGDLLGNLSHEDQFAVLNNHNLFGGSANGFYRIVYDDSSAGQFFFSRHTDGPGTLNNFAGQSSSGVWLLTMSDDSLNRTGLVNSFTVRVEPQRDLLGGGLTNSVLANQWNYYFVDVPPDASSLTVLLSSMDGPLELYLRRGALPTTTDYDKRALIDPTGGSLSIGVGDVPPLNAGRYFIGVFNPTANTVTYVIRVVIDRNLPAIAAQTYVSTNPPPALVDDAISRSSMLVTNSRPVTDVEVAVRIDHVRASDLVLHLVNPQGERVLLAENRGGPSRNGYGLSLFTTNFLAATNSGGSTETRTTYNVGTNKGTLKIDYDFGGAEADILRVYYDAIRIFDSGPTFGTGTFTVNFGPGISTNITIVVNEGSPPRPTPSVWRYSAYILTDLRMVYTVFSEDTNVTLAPIKFGVAPFATGGGISTNLLFTNSFEGAVADTYCAVTNFDGWQVVSNQVAVVNNPVVSHTGTNHLALLSGHTFLTLPTLAGQQYRLRHVYRTSPPDLSLVSWWPGNGDAIDIADGNSGSLVGGILFGGGIVGQAFELDGVDDHVIIPASTNLHVRSVTFDAWILPTDLSVPRPILEYANANSNSPVGAHFWIGPSSVPPFFGAGKLFVNFRYDNLPGDVPPYKVVESNPGLIKTGEWQHVAATYDQVSGEARLYLNGEVVGATNLGVFLPATTFQNVLIGRRPLTSPDGSAGANFVGKIDEVDVWNRALSTNEIRAIYLAGSLGKCGAQTFKHPTPLSLWPAEGTAADLVDGNPGTLVGGVTYATGMVGQAFSFNGTGEIRVNDNANLNLQRFTFETWVFPTALDGEIETILYREEETPAPQQQYALGIKGSQYISAPAGMAPGRFAFAVRGLAGLPDDFAGWVDGGGTVPTNQWTHLAVTFDGNSVKAFINGAVTRNITNVTGNVPTIVAPLKFGSRSAAVLNVVPNDRFNGRIDEMSIYDRALDGCEIQAIHYAGSFGKYSLFGRLAPCDVNALVIVDGRLTNSVIGTLNWQTNTMDFTATQNGTPVLLAGDRPEMWFDTFELFELRGLNTYYLAEEPMKPLLGQPATGTWTLEVWDNRVGGLTTTPPTILSWELRLTLANTNPPATLLTNFPPVFTNIYSVFDTNGVPATVCVAGNEIKYFMVDVPRRATMATNVLDGTGDLVLLYNPTGLPSGALPGDVVVDANPGAGIEGLILNTNAPPQLQRGQRYYLGVANANPGETNCFTLTVGFDRIDASLLNPIALTNGVPYTNAIPATNAIDYYQFTVSTNAASVAFELFPQDGNVDLIVRKALPVPDPLPRPNPGLYDYVSQNTGTAPDQIIVTPASSPVPLAPGVWYLGVYNVDTNLVNYSVRVTESTNTALNIIPLTNAVPLNYTIAAGSAWTNFFLFTIGQTNAAVLFELYNLNSDANFYVKAGQLPTPIDYLTADFGTPARPAQIVIRTNAVFPSINGDWYLAVDDYVVTNLSFTIRAIVSTNGMLESGIPLVITIRPAVPPSTGFEFSWPTVRGEKYVIETSSDLVNWTLLDTIYANDVFTTYNDATGGSLTLLFYRIRQVPLP